MDRPAFFASFNEGEAVPYFYEPFLQAFDPALRKQLGVWYTPTEVVQYMVARVDKALRDDLDIPDGLAADNVYILDPCCGTGAYLAEVLRRIAANLEGRGLGALAGARVRQAATERVFGFEIMPAPFVVAHLQVGLTMQDLDAPLAEDGSERAGVFLTNALTGWEPRTNKPLPFPELEEERDRAEKVKQEAPILVILGNPPYNGFPGLAMEEERELTDAYRATKRVRRPEGRGLNDLYVRFFRMAERRIAERTGQGIVCFISSYSWLDGLSFTGMRERYVEAFDCVRIDCLNGDKYKTGKIAPDGSPDPSIFSTEGNPAGIQVGTAVTTLVRKADHAPAPEVRFRHLWGRRKREELHETADAEPEGLYEGIEPSLPLGLPFLRTAVDERWFDWPALPDLFPMRFHGVLTNRDAFLVDVDLERLRERVGDYFDPNLSHEEIERRYPSAMKSTARFDARAGREELLARGGPVEDGFCRITYRPFDNRWLYWEEEMGLFDRPRPDYRQHIAPGNLWLTASQHVRKDASEPQAAFTRHLGSHHLIERGSNLFPAYLRQGAAGGAVGRLLANDGGARAGGDGLFPNLTADAERYLGRIGASVENLFHFALATLHDAEYRDANADGLRLGWPRIPATGLVGRRRRCGRRPVRRRRGPRPRTRSTPRPGGPRSRRHDRRLAPRDRRHRGPDHRRWPPDDRRRLRRHRRLGPLRRRPSCHARPRPRGGALVHRRGTSCPRRCGLRARRERLRHLPEFPCVLAQRPRRRLAVPPRRVSGPEEVALLPGTRGPRSSLDVWGGPVLLRKCETNRGPVAANG